MINWTREKIVIKNWARKDRAELGKGKIGAIWSEEETVTNWKVVVFSPKPSGDDSNQGWVSSIMSGKL